MVRALRQLSPRFTPAALAALCLLAACSIFRPDAKDKGSIIFSHSQHLEQADCQTCHEGVAKDEGQKQAGAFIPRKHEVCESCHDVSEKCGTCHRGPPEGARFPREERHLRFAHATHTATVDNCQRCHPAGKRGGASIPGHPTCNTADCHRPTYSALRCRTCHQSMQRYRLEPLTDLAHGPDFERRHGPLARQAVEACASCHDQTFCADCHAAKTQVAKPELLFPEEIERDFIHRGDFVGRHFIEARAAPHTCRKCHGQRHCRACHALNGLAVAPHADLPGGRKLDQHPSGWLEPGSGQFHGQRARQDIASCASCHDRGSSSNCVACHRVGGLGGSPHPTNWSWQDKRSECRGNTMCASCHPGGQGCP